MPGTIILCYHLDTDNWTKAFNSHNVALEYINSHGCESSSIGNYISGSHESKICNAYFGCNEDIMLNIILLPYIVESAVLYMPPMKMMDMDKICFSRYGSSSTTRYLNMFLDLWL